MPCSTEKTDQTGRCGFAHACQTMLVQNCLSRLRAGRRHKGLPSGTCITGTAEKQHLQAWLRKEHALRRSQMQDCHLTHASQAQQRSSICRHGCAKSMPSICARCRTCSGLVSSNRPYMYDRWSACISCSHTCIGVRSADAVLQLPDGTLCYYWHPLLIKLKLADSADTA